MIDKRAARNRLNQFREGLRIMELADLTADEFEVLCRVAVMAIEHDNDVRQPDPMRRPGKTLCCLRDSGWIELHIRRLTLTEKALTLLNLSELPVIHLPRVDQDDPLEVLFVGLPK